MKRDAVATMAFLDLTRKKRGLAFGRKPPITPIDWKEDGGRRAFAAIHFGQDFNSNGFPVLDYRIIPVIYFQYHHRPERPDPHLR